MFPKFFARINQFGAPGAGIVLSSILVSVLMISNFTKGLNSAFEFMILLSTLTVLVPYLFSSASYIILSRGNRKFPSTKNVIIGLLAFSFSLFAVIGSGQEVVYWGFIMLILGIPIYVLLRLRNQP